MYSKSIFKALSIYDALKNIISWAINVKKKIINRHLTEKISKYFLFEENFAVWLVTPFANPADDTEVVIAKKFRNCPNKVYPEGPRETARTLFNKNKDPILITEEIEVAMNAIPKLLLVTLTFKAFMIFIWGLNHLL